MELHCLPLLPHHISNPFQRSHSVLFQFQVNFVPFFSSSLIFYLIRLNHSSSEVSFWLAFFFFFICTFMLLVQALITSWLLSSAQTFPFHPIFLFLFVFVFFFHFTLYFTVSAFLSSHFPQTCNNSFLNLLYNQSDIPRPELSGRSRIWPHTNYLTFPITILKSPFTTPGQVNASTTLWSSSTAFIRLSFFKSSRSLFKCHPLREALDHQKVTIPLLIIYWALCQ